MDGDAVMLEAVEKRVHQRLALEEIVPLGVVQVRRDDTGKPGVAQVEQFEKGVDLLRFQGQIAKLVHQ